MEYDLQLLGLLDESQDSTDSQRSKYGSSTAELDVNLEGLQGENDQSEDYDGEIKDVPRVAEIHAFHGDKLDDSFERKYACEYVIQYLDDLGQLHGLVKPNQSHDDSVEHDTAHDKILEPDALRDLDADTAKAINSNASDEKWLRLEAIGHNLHFNPRSLLIF